MQSLKTSIERAAHLLPAQGPLTVFVHHNTLHAFEHLAFEDAVAKGGRIFGCQPYLSEDRFRRELKRERITDDDLIAVLLDELGASADETFSWPSNRLELRLAQLRYAIRTGPAAELNWFISETDALTRFRDELTPEARKRFLETTKRWVLRNVRQQKSSERDENGPFAFADVIGRFGAGSIERWPDKTWEAFSLQVLWRICLAGVLGLPAKPSTKRLVRPRDALFAATGVDSDELTHELLIRFCSAFLDQGMALWKLPNRDRGLFESFCRLYGKPLGPPDTWLAPLQGELQRILEAGTSPLELIEESLSLFGVAMSDREEFIASTFLALRGWAGMIHQMELRADRVVYPAPTGSLQAFLAIRLLIDRLAVTHVAREELGFTGPLDQVGAVAALQIKKDFGENAEQRAFNIFQLAQAMGWTPDSLIGLTKAEWARLVNEVESFPELERRRLFQMAFERNYRNRTLDAIAIHAKPKPTRAAKPRFQVICCIDEREESFRRHLEELAPDVETFGAAGFFSVAMYYRGIGDALFVPLCPVAVTPKQWVVEEPAFTFVESHHRRASARRQLGAAAHQVHEGSRTAALGAFLTATTGFLASIPLVARVLFPRWTGRVSRKASQWVRPPAATELRLERETTHSGWDGEAIGFSVAEMADAGERLLRDIGLTSGFAPLVLILGHGSASQNNPHKSAYDCGACGGGAGGPNARAIAQILNERRVRNILSQRGIKIPDETTFVGGLHNTCNDDVTFLDLDRLPRIQRKAFAALRNCIDPCSERNAHERCRRFQSAPLDQSYAAARRHVEARSEDLAQARPECGHATNAVCFVGRRARTRGLFMDRRSFLVSYDPTCDLPGEAILTRILQAVFPVCSGINLEYYFSYVDPAGWGSGTKLPHNIASLLGVMDGAASDLRPGLPWQMVEIHEPIRLLFVLETTPEKIAGILSRNEGLGQLCRNRWIQLATLDPDSDAVHYWKVDHFERHVPLKEKLPVSESSIDWYRGWRDHLDYAQIDPNAPRAEKKTKRDRDATVDLPSGPRRRPPA